MNNKELTKQRLEIALLFAKQSTCIHRKVGAVIAKDGMIIGTGYKDVPEGEKNCLEHKDCPFDQDCCDTSQCRAVHAAADAIISASKSRMEGATIYLAAIGEDGALADPQPCLECRRLIKRAGIKTAIGMDPVTGQPETLDLSTHNRPARSPVELDKLKKMRVEAIKKAWRQRMQETAQMTISKRQAETLHLFSQLLRLEQEPFIKFHQLERTFPILFESMDIWKILREYHVGCSGGRGNGKHYEYVFFISGESEAGEV